QGFALGGEVGPTTAYLVEAAPVHRRGFYSSMQYASQDTAVLAAGLVGTALASMLDAQQLQDWGWRVAMLVGALIVPFGLIVRRGLPETLHAADDAALAPDATTGELSWSTKLKPYLALIILGLMMLMAGTIANYVTSYMTTYALETLHMQATIAFGVIIVNGVFSVMFEPISGWLSDIYGRKPVMLVPGIIMLLSILPCFWLISHFRTAIVFYTMMAWLSALTGLNTTPVVTVITESLPKSIRSGTLATVYAFAISIFGGSTQFMVNWLIDVTKDPLAPAYYWSTALVIGLIAMALVKESAPLIRGPFDSA
ncbi:MAG TPA: MFS transporter, partial [Rhizomicrobium sp.]|nr:MFS transporter [Rhizomicrobium sp.]